MTTPTGHGFRFEPGSEGVQIDAPLLDISMYAYAQEVADLAADLFHAQTQVSLGSKQQYQHNGVHLFTDKALSERDASVDVRVRRSTMADVRRTLVDAVKDGVLHFDIVNSVLSVLNLEPIVRWRAWVEYDGVDVLHLADLPLWLGDGSEAEDYVTDNLSVSGSVTIRYEGEGRAQEFKVDLGEYEILDKIRAVVREEQ